MIKGVSYCNFFINKNSHMAILHCPTVALGWAWSLCGLPLLTPCNCSAPSMSLPAQGHPVCQQGYGENDSDPQRNPPALRAGWALQALHRLEPAPPALMMLAACCDSLSTPHRTVLSAPSPRPSEPFPLCTPAEQWVLCLLLQGGNCPQDWSQPCLSTQGLACLSCCSGESLGGTPWLILYVVLVTCQLYQGY